MKIACITNQTEVRSKPMIAKGHITDYIIFEDGTIVLPSGQRCTVSLIKDRFYARYMCNGNRLCRRLDYLVAENFLPIPVDPIRLHHKDGEHGNCAASNLEWVTKADIIEQHRHLYAIDDNIGLEEAWRELDTPMGILNVSSFGRIRMHGSTVDLPQYDSHGYKVLYYTLKNGTDSETKLLNVHRLVAEAFIPNPNGYDTVNHLDANKGNCHIWNLEWCSKAMNTEHSYLHNGFSRYSERAIASVCHLLATTQLSHVDIAKITSVDRKVISDIYRGTRHQDVSSKYTFPAKRWNKDIAMKMVALMNAGYRGKEVLRELNIEPDQAAISFYERTRRQYKDLISA